MASPADDVRGLATPPDAPSLQETAAAPPDTLPQGSSGKSWGRTGSALNGDPGELLGQTLGGRYRLEKLLGKGGMGAVFEGLDLQEQQRRALKVVLASERDPDGLRRFVREARASREIDSEHVVRVIDAETDAERNLPFIVMELLDGEDLDQLVKRAGPLEPAALCRFFMQACEGLAAAHAAGIIHRDIKPANLFLHRLPSGPLIAKVCDFGVAKKTGLDTSQTSELTQTGGMVGSPMFMSPEQAKSAKHVDHRSDIWSLAISMYQALSGQKPWATQSGSLGELILAICTADLAPLQDLAPWIPPGLADAVHRALLREPAERYASVDEFRAALAPFAAPPERLTSAALTSISDSVRNTVAPRATGFGASRSSGSASLSRTTPNHPAPRPRSPYLLPAVVFASITGVGISAVIALKTTSSPAATNPSSSAPLASVSPSAPPTASSAALVASGSGSKETLKVAGKLLIRGVPASLSVNGAPREVPSSGELLLEGEPGETFLIEVQAGKARRSERVILSRDGSLSPSELVVLGGPAMPVGKPPGAAVTAATTAATAAATATTAATTTPPRPPAATGTVKPREEFLGDPPRLLEPPGGPRGGPRGAPRGAARGG